MTGSGGYKPREPGSLKEAEASLVKACGGLEAAAHLSRVKKSQLARYTDPGEADYHMPADVIRALELHCGVPHVTRFLAIEAGAVLIPLPRDGSRKACMKHLAGIGRDSGKLYGAACDALADGTLSGADRARVRSEAMKTMSALAALIADMRESEPHGR